MGSYDRALDDLSFVGFFPWSHGGKESQSSVEPYSETPHEVGGAGSADELAARSEDSAGSGSGSLRHTTEGVQRGSGDTQRGAGTIQHGLRFFCLAPTFHFWVLNEGRVDALGVPPHGSSSAAIWSLSVSVAKHLVRSSTCSQVQT